MLAVGFRVSLSHAQNPRNTTLLHSASSSLNEEPQQQQKQQHQPQQPQ